MCDAFILAAAVFSMSCKPADTACAGLDLTCNPVGFLLRGRAGIPTGSGLLPTSGRVKSLQKINDTTGGLTGGLEDSGFFGRASVSIGDLDGDGIPDFAVGAWADDDGGVGDTGAVWILFANRDGTVKGQQVISLAAGGFTGPATGGDYIGTSLAPLGDLDGDGRVDLAMGGPKTASGGTFRGSIWVLFLNSNGTVKAEQRITNSVGGLPNVLIDDDQFGTSLTYIGDLDKDGVPDLAVGAVHDDDGGTDRGAVWILFMNTNGTVKTFQKISNTAGGFGGTLANSDNFGSEVAGIGDLDGDGVLDLAVGSGGIDDGGTDRGAVWILFMNTNGTVKSYQKISNTTGGFTAPLANADTFGGLGLNGPGDIDGDGIPDLFAGAVGDDDGGANRGALYVLFLNRNGTVKSHQKISSTQGNFAGPLADGEVFGGGIGFPGDLNGDLVPDIIVGASGGAPNGRGAAWVLFLEPK